MTVKWVQDPEAVLDYTLDWTKLMVTGDTIVAVTFTPDSGLTNLSQNFAALTVTVWLQGGTGGTVYNVVCHITTAAGRQLIRTFQISVKDQ